MTKLLNTRIFGFPIVITLIATFWLLVATWMWTGSLFNGVNFPGLPDWPKLNGLTDEDMSGLPVAWQLIGVFAIFLQTAGLVTLLKLRNVSTLLAAVKTGLFASLFFSIPIVMYPLSFRPEHSVTLFLINAGNYMFGLATTAMVITGLMNFSREKAATLNTSDSALITS